MLYTVHFYAGSHYFQQDIENIAGQLPLFVSEWGTSNHSGNGGADYANAQAWLDLMAGQNPAGQKISYCNWSFAGKEESSAALNPGACSSQNWNNTTTSGTWVKNHILSPADDFGPVVVVSSITLTAPTGNTTVTTGSLGRERLQMGSAAAGQSVTFGEFLPAGDYLLQIQYQSRQTRAEQ